MALYRLNESFVLYEDMQVEERSLDSLNKQQKEQ